MERSGLGIRAGNVLVTIRDYNTLTHLKWVLERTDTKDQDIVVMSARVSQFGTAAYDLATEQIFSDYEQHLFTKLYRLRKALENTSPCWLCRPATCGPPLYRPQSTSIQPRSFPVFPAR